MMDMGLRSIAFIAVYLLCMKFISDTTTTSLCSARRKSRVVQGGTRWAPRLNPAPALAFVHSAGATQP